MECKKGEKNEKKSFVVKATTPPPGGRLPVKMQSVCILRKHTFLRLSKLSLLEFSKKISHFRKKPKESTICYKFLLSEKKSLKRKRKKRLLDKKQQRKKNNPNRICFNSFLPLPMIFFFLLSKLILFISFHKYSCRVSTYLIVKQHIRMCNKLHKLSKLMIRICNNLFGGGGNQII